MNDDRDAAAIAAAATRPTMRFVALKSEAQLDMRTPHRARDRRVGERTALINQLRAILLERSLIIAQGRRNLEREHAVLCEENSLRVRQRLLMPIEDMREEWRVLDSRIAAFDDEFAGCAKNDEAARRLATIPGIGVLNAAALAAAIGEGRTFARGRDLAACPGRSRRAASPVSPRSPSEAMARLTQAADPRRQGCSPDAFQERNAAEMVARAYSARAQERRGRRLAQQARPGRVAA